MRPSELIRDWIDHGGDPHPMVAAWADMQVNIWAGRLLQIRDRAVFDQAMAGMPPHHREAILARARKLKKSKK